MVHSHELFTTKLSDINKVETLNGARFQADRAEWRPNVQFQKSQCD